MHVVKLLIDDANWYEDEMVADDVNWDEVGLSIDDANWHGDKLRLMMSIGMK